MYEVTETYKTESRKQVRNQSHISIEFRIEEVDTPSSVTITNNSESYLSDTDNIVSADYIYDKTYHTLEFNRWILNGSQITPPNESDPVGLYQGWISEVMSGEDRIYTTQPILELNFSQYFKFRALTFQFDTVTGDHPSEMRMQVYKDAELLDDLVVNPDNASWIYEETVPNNPELTCNRIVLTFIKSSVPYRRVRLSNIMFGVVKNYSNYDIESATSKNEVDLISTKLPTESFDFTILDTTNSYDPNNPKGFYYYIESRQSVKLRIGYQLDDESVEWIPYGNLYSTGEIDVNTESRIQKITIKSQSSLNTLTDTYNEGVYDGMERSLYDLAVTLLEFPKTIKPSYVIDESLKNYKTVAPLPVDAVKNNLQLIANAGMCMLYTDRYGIIHIAKENTLQSDFYLSTNDTFTAPNLTKYPQLRSVITKLYSLAKQTETSELGKAENVSSTEDAVVEISHSMATDISVSGSGVTIVKTEPFAYMTRVTYRGSGTITVNGKQVDITETTLSFPFNETGEDCEISNELITSQQHVNDYANWIGVFEQRRNEYNTTDRGYPELDVGDVITADVPNTENLKATLLKHDITFNGAIRGSTKFLP